MFGKVKLVSVAVMAMFALGAMTASVASAEMKLPELLPKSNGTATSGKGALEVKGGAKIKCEEGRATFTATSTNLGTYTIGFTRCTEGGEECHSLGDTAGAILTSGTWHLVLEIIGTEHLWLIDFLIAERDTSAAVHIECPRAPVKLFLIWGSQLALITPAPNIVTSEFALTLVEGRNKGEPKERSYLNNSEVLVIDVPMVSQEGGAAKEGAITSERNIVLRTEVRTEIMN